MKRSLRFDANRIDATRRDQNGYLEADAAVTRTGVFAYHHPDGSTTRELRHPDEVLKADSLATLRNRPITLGHPAAGKVNSKNTRRLAVGAVIGDVAHDGRLVKTKLQITDEDAIERVLDRESPIREVSCGYDAEVVPLAGEYNGEKYDHVQKNIVYNHVAIVPRGRAGREVGIRLDAADAFMADEEEQEFVSRCMGDPKKLSEFPDEKQRAAVCYEMFRRGDALENADETANNPSRTKSDDHSQEKANMSKTKIRRDAVATKTFKADACVIELDGTVEASEKAVDMLGARFDAAVEQIKSLEAANQQLQGKLDAIGESGKISAVVLDEMVRDRTEALGVAHYIGLQNYNKLETDQLKKAIVMKAFPHIDTAELTPPYVAGRYDAVCDQIKREEKNLQSFTQLKDVAENPGLFGIKQDEGESPRDALLKKTDTMWKGKQANA